VHQPRDLKSTKYIAQSKIWLRFLTASSCVETIKLSRHFPVRSLPFRRPGGLQLLQDWFTETEDQAGQKLMYAGLVDSDWLAIRRRRRRRRRPLARTTRESWSRSRASWATQPCTRPTTRKGQPTNCRSPPCSVHARSCRPKPVKAGRASSLSAGLVVGKQYSLLGRPPST
jgi:hypothetical protein